MLDKTATVSALPFSSDLLSLTPLDNGKRKRKPPGTPDPEAEVVSLSPQTLLESDRYVCEICNQGFQRDQNLQMHRRRHKVPWKLVKNETQEVVKKKVYVCPEPSCLHHNPCHALGDLVGIKKHFRRKHSLNKQWVCDKCFKGYAVQSDYKAHLRTCGTKGHSCDCGRVFSRVESFIEHQDICSVRGVQHQFQALQYSRLTSSTTPSIDANFSLSPPLPIPKSTGTLELQLLPSSSTHLWSWRNSDSASLLKLSIGSTEGNGRETAMEATRLKEFASEQLKLAMREKTHAEKAREEAKREIEMAELEFASAKRIKQQAENELEKALVLKHQATKKITATIMQITCQACRNRFITSMAAVPAADETSLAMSYMSSATTEGEGE